MSGQNSSRDQLKKTLKNHLNRLWSAWGALGIYADTKKEDVGLEESFIMLCIIGRFDGRLFDEALSIAITLSRYFSLNKLKYWSNFLDKDSKQVFDCLSAIVIEKSGEKRLSKLVPIKKDYGPLKSLFLNVNYETVPHGRSCDDLFLQYGLVRNNFQLSENIIPLKALATKSPSLKAKLIFGVGVASDILTKLATMGSYTASELARHTGYSKQAISKYLQNLEIAGIVTSMPVRDKKFFSLQKSKSKLFSDFKVPKRNFRWFVDVLKFGYYYHTIFQLPKETSDDLSIIVYGELTEELTIKLPV
jgi:DNA-binding transcriptional ArsR family regulator